ncbi:AAA family ATPase [uncultured Legionella sp.]|jgi:type II secretory pathway predicted ATPase ExeA|uniref:AAA family ATPase n=1 Tax=uncultured Legionella sp. TaxID=210934 RepID=UPI0026285F32|nr:AAA family ATPase [uncultured Legionella sp.]
MILDALEEYSLIKPLSEAGFYATDKIKRLHEKIKNLALSYGSLIAVSGTVGSGKTTFINELMHDLKKEGKCIVSYSYSSDREGVNVKTLLTALLIDVNKSDKPSPTGYETRDRHLVKLMEDNNKPVVLFIDEAQDLHGNTLSALKKLSEMAKLSRQTLTIILAGQPKLKNTIRSAKMEEIGSRAYVIDLDEQIIGKKDKYLQWAITQCLAKDKKWGDVITQEALTHLTEHLITPLQIISHFNRALEIGFSAGVKPINKEVIDQVLKPLGSILESRYARSGYRIGTLAKILHTSEREINQWFLGKLPELRVAEIQEALVHANVIV